jgi:hypothetical protein
MTMGNATTHPAARNSTCMRCSTGTDLFPEVGHLVLNRSSLPDAVQVLLATKDQLVAADRGRGPEDFIVEPVRRDQFELWSRRDHVSNSGIVQ